MTKLLPAGRRHPFNGILRSISLGFAEQTTVRGFKNRLWAVEPSRLFGLLIATCIALPAIVSPVRAVTFEATVRDSISGTPVEGIVLWNWEKKDIEGTSDKDGRIVIPGMMPGEFQFHVKAVGDDHKPSGVAGKYARWWSPQAKHAHEREELERKLDVPRGLDAASIAQLRLAMGIDGFQRNLDSLTYDLAGKKTAVEIFVEPAATITGRVVDPDGMPVAGATVAPAKTGSGNSLTGDTRYSYLTDEEGRFTMALPAGKQFEYNIVAHDGTYDEWRKWANGHSETLRTQPGEKIEGLEIQLTRGGMVRGMVVDSEGHPKPEVEVRAAAVDMRDNRYYVPTTKTGNDGRFELSHISPGEQHIQASPFWLRAEQAPKQSTKIVTVEADGTVEDVELTTE